MSSEEGTIITCDSGILDLERAPLAVKRWSFYRWALFIIAIGTIYIFSYERLTQFYWPDYSLEALLFRLGILNDYSLPVEPGKGLWRDLGWAGSGMMVLLMTYSLRKRVAFFKPFGPLRYWLGFHMYLGIVGPVLVTVHTTFKLGGIISTAFWCMLVTVCFGIMGRYIYRQIPRNVSGAEMEVDELDSAVQLLDDELLHFMSVPNLSRLLKVISFSDEKIEETRCPITVTLWMMKEDLRNRFKVRRLRGILKERTALSKAELEEVLTLLKQKAAILRRRGLLKTSHTMLHYWHIMHIPLALVMFLLMFVHIVVHYLFRPGI